MIPIRTFFFRSFSIIGAIDNRPVINSISHLNYYKITPNNMIRHSEGSSPGLIAGFLYCFPNPISYFLLFTYVITLRAFINRVFSYLDYELNLIGSFIALLFLLPLFESPIDLLIIVNDGLIFIYFFLIIFIYGNLRRAKEY